MKPLLRHLLCFLTAAQCVTGLSAQDLLTFEAYYDDDPSGQIKHRYTFYLDEMSNEVKHGEESFWHSNGNLGFRGNWADGLPQGIFKVYWLEGPIRQEIPHSDGKLNGTQIDYLLTGEKAIETVWVDDVKISETLFLPDGARFEEKLFAADGSLTSLKRWDGVDNLTLQEQYKNGLKDGEWLTASPGGHLLTRGNWKEGIRHGLQQEFYPAAGLYSTLKLEELYDNGVIQNRKEWGIYTLISDTLIPSSMFETQYQNGNIVGGIARTYFSTLALAGEVETWVPYQDGVPHGDWFEYHVNLAVKTAGTYLAGRKEGLEISYHLNGLKKSEFNYSSDLLHGPFDEWDDNGTRIRTGAYENGLKHGEFTEFYADGKRFRIENYYQGLKDGVFMFWSEEGILLKSSSYRLGKLHGIETVYFDNGEVDTRTPYVDGLKHGLVINRSQVGSEVQTEYLYGKRHGREWFYNDDGQLTETRTYSNDRRCGTFNTQVWDEDQMQEITVETNRPCERLEIPNTVLPEPEEPDFAVVNGRVSDAESGHPIEGATVTLGSVSAQTDGGGKFSFTSPKNAASTIQFSKAGYLTSVVPITSTLRNYHTFYESLQLAVDNRPVVTKVSSSSGVVFLEGITVENIFSAQVHWASHSPGWVRFDLNGNAVEIVADAGGASKSYDMGGFDFDPSFDPKRNRLTLTAVTAQGIQSAPLTIYPAVAPIPGWVAAMAFTGIGTGGQVRTRTYAFGGEFPGEPIQLRFDPKDWNSLVQAAWAVVPFLGGHPIGFPPSQVVLAADLKTSGEGSLAGGVQSGFEIAGGSIQGKFGAKGIADYVPRSGFALKESELTVGVGGSVMRSEGLGLLIPPLKAAEKTPLIGRVFKAVNSVAEVEGTAGVAGEMVFKFAPDPASPTGLAFLPAEPALGGSIGLALNLGNDRVVNLAFGGGGSLKFVWQVPPSPSFLKQLEAELTAKAEVVVLGLGKFPFEQKHTFVADSSGGGMALSPATALEPVPPPAMELISRGFLTREDYETFVANDGPRIQPQGISGPPPGENTLIQNVFPESSTAIARHDGKTAIAYVHFDPGDATLQATEIHFIWHDGASYSAPMAIQDDTRAEHSPDLAFDANGKLVAVWQRIKDPAFTSTELVDLLANIEIVTAVFDPAGGQWSAPVALTDNAHLDHSPLLSRGRDGSLMLVWQSNSGNELIGTPDNPTQVHYAFWNAQTEQFDAAQTIGSSFVNAQAFSFAHDGAESILAYTRDMDGDLTTSDDLEIHYLLRDGDGWSLPVQVTDDTVADSNPEIVYKAGGSRELIWKHGTDLTRLTDWATGAFATIRANSSSAGFLDFLLTCDSQDRLAVVWQALGESGPDLFYSVYDPENEVWSLDVQLTRDAGMESGFRGGLDANNNLQLVYLKKDLETTEADLVHLVRPLGRDLAVATEDLSIDPADPAPGTEVTLKAVIRNSGDLAVENIAVNFHLGNPDAGGQLIGSSTATPTLLRGGESGEASLAWTVPQELSELNVFAVVDPSGAVSEKDETNNQAAFAILRPDLVASSCRIEEHGDGSLDVILVIENNGPADAADIPVLFSVEGRDLGFINLPNLPVGSSAEIANLIWADIQLTNRPSKVEVIIDPDNLIAESDEDNNTCTRTVTLTADTDQDGIEDSWERFHFGHHDQDGQADSDDDGMNDLLEFLAGTHPMDAQSLFTGTITRPGVDGSVTLAWASEPGHTYQVQYKNDLDDPQWTNLGNPMTLSATNGMIVDTPPGGTDRRIYRVQLISP